MPTAKASAPTTRRKFATPPVKVACLSCRAARIRCDSKDQSIPCTRCSVKNQECSYVPSKRGGPRPCARRASATTSEVTTTQQPQANDDGRQALDSVPDVALMDIDMEMETDLDVQTWCDDDIFPFDFGLNIDFDADRTPSFVNPGAGLRILSNEDQDFMYDSIFPADSATQVSNQNAASRPTQSLEARADTPIRIYGSDRDITDAYYIFIHPFFPVLPPPDWTPHDNPVRHASESYPSFEPSSPLSLAISAILATIPPSSERQPPPPELLILRRNQAQAFAQSALESIEIQSELVQSATDPSQALSNGPSSLRRDRVHPKTPFELEGILALLVLSVYEYAQRGNIARMKTRAGQALVAAMDLSLHEETSHPVDEFKEARRRAWWMTYTCVCQGSIVSGTPLIMSAHDHRFTAKCPTLAHDEEAWPFFIQAQQSIVAATQFVIDLNKALKSRTSMAYVCERMQELDGMIEPLVMKAEAMDLDTPSAPLIDASEAVVARSLKGIARIKLNSARIKLHRYCAFMDKPVFSARHCDLAPTSTCRPNKCPCNTLFTASGELGIQTTDITPPASSTASSLHSSAESISSSPSSSIDSFPLGSTWQAKFPFSSHQSARICFKSAIRIAHSFRGLPHPNPTASLQDSSAYQAPRTMPSFACCAMQSCYALLMLCYKTKALGSSPNSNANHAQVEQLLAQLHNGIALVLEALTNYSVAFEALDGMREQISSALDKAMELGKRDIHATCQLTSMR